MLITYGCGMSGGGVKKTPAFRSTRVKLTFPIGRIHRLLRRIKAKSKSRSIRAGLQFPVDRIHHLLRKGKYADVIKSDASVYLTAVMESIVSKVLELVGNAAHNNNRTRIVLGHFQLAIQDNKDLEQMFSLYYHHPSRRFIL